MPQSYFFKFYFYIFLPSTFSSSSRLFPQVFLPKLVCISPVPIRATCPACLNFLDQKTATFNITLIPREKNAHSLLFSFSSLHIIISFLDK
jgi:hypothetical protein